MSQRPRRGIALSHGVSPHEAKLRAAEEAALLGTAAAMYLGGGRRELVAIASPNQTTPVPTVRRFDQVEYRIGEAIRELNYFQAAAESAASYGIIRHWDTAKPSPKGSVPADVLADELYRLHLLGQTDRALDTIFRWVDADMKSTRGRATNDLLSRIDEHAFDEDMLVGFLSATYPGRRLLPAREAFAMRVRTRLAPEIGGDEAATLINDLL